MTSRSCDPGYDGRRPAPADRLLAWSRLVARRRSRHVAEPSGPTGSSGICCRAPIRGSIRSGRSGHSTPRERRDPPAPRSRSGERDRGSPCADPGLVLDHAQSAQAGSDHRSGPHGRNVRYVTLVVPMPRLEARVRLTGLSIHGPKVRFTLNVDGRARARRDRTASRGGENPPQGHLGSQSTTLILTTFIRRLPRAHRR